MSDGAEKVNPYAGDNRRKSEQVKEMFDNIAPAYDFMNRAMTFGIDKIWRRKAVKMVRRSEPKRILDVATGTGDLAILLARKVTDATITGIDLSEGMVEVGRRKVERAGLADRVTLEIGDCLQLPFADATFDCVTVAYGVRNFQNLLEGYRQMYRVLRPGGMLCVIELSTPTGWLTRPLYNVYSRRVIPAIGRMVSGDSSAYTYLPESIAAVAQGEDMCSLIREAGFEQASFRRLTFGTCTIYLATK